MAPLLSIGGVSIPTLLSCGDSDPVAPCDMSRAAYDAVADPTPKMLLSIPGATHFHWYDPKAAPGEIAGQYTLAFQKVFLEGDERWRRLLLQPPATGMQVTNIQ